MSESRAELVRWAFKSLDRSGRGAVDAETVKSAFDAKGHPEVLDGKRSEDEVLMDFLETFDEHHNYLAEPGPDGRVNQQEFEDYYGYVSMCIEDDGYFEALIKNVWRLSGTAEPRPEPQAGHYEEELKAAPAPKREYQPPVPAPVQAPAMAPAHLVSPYRSPGKRGIANISSIDNTLELSAKLYNQIRSAKKEQSKITIESVLGTFRNKLAARGVRGFMGIWRQFKVSPYERKVEDRYWTRETAGY